MKINYLHQYYIDPRVQAGGTRSHEFAWRLAELGHDVEVWTSTDCAQDGLHRPFQLRNFATSYDNQMSIRRRLTAFLSFMFRTSLKALFGPKPDIVIATSTPLTVAVPALLFRARGVPFVFEVRDLWPEVPYQMGAFRIPLALTAARFLERQAYTRSVHVVALSPGMRDGVLEIAPDTSVTVVPNAADLDLFRVQHGRTSESLSIIYAGTLGRANDVPYLAETIQALDRLWPEDVKPLAIDIFGYGSERHHLDAIAESLDCVQLNLRTQVPKAELAEILPRYDISLVTFSVRDYPVLETNSANKFYDSLASGTAIGVNYGGWHSDLLKTWDAGIYLGEDPETAAATLITFLTTADIDAAGANARQLAEDQFDREQLFELLRAVVEEAARDSE